MHAAAIRLTKDAFAESAIFARPNDYPDSGTTGRFAPIC